MAAAQPAKPSRRRASTAERAEVMMRLEALSGQPEKIQQSDLEIVLQGLKLDHLRCRDRGHVWPMDDEDIIWSTTMYGNTRRDMVCARCTMMRHELIRWDGTVYTRWYTAPRGYYIVGVKDRTLGLRLQFVRREVLRRKFGDAKILPIKKSWSRGRRR